MTRMKLMNFLDQVIQDYEAYAKENQRLQMENDRLVSKSR